MKTYPRKSALLILIFGIILLTGCVKNSINTAVVSKYEDATQSQLIEQIVNLAKITSLNGKLDVQFEDNSFAASGLAEKYKSADGSVIVQRPAKINFRIEVPFIKTDEVLMTSDGEKFRVAIPPGAIGISEKFKKFVFGTNNADYSRLETKLDEKTKDETAKENQSAKVFAQVRPQHLTDALLVRPIEVNSDGKFIYVMSEFFQEDYEKSEKNSTTKRILRGYYFLDEVKRKDDGTYTVSRRFWFDRIGTVTLARQQVYEGDGILVSDINYGPPTKFSETGDYNLPLFVQVTRPREKYKVKLTFQTPELVKIGKEYKPSAFVLENSWGLPEVDLDKKLAEMRPNK